MKTKECENPGCERPPFEYKNPRKKFHDLHCKNQAAYIYKQKHYAWEAKMLRSRWKNIQVLEYLLKNGHKIILMEQLEIMGFDFEAAHVPYKNEKNFVTYRYGNIEMLLISKTECELLYITK